MATAAAAATSRITTEGVPSDIRLARQAEVETAGTAEESAKDRAARLVLYASARAAGAPIPGDEAPILVESAHKDLNCKGRGPEWYRLAWRDGTWRYIGERLPSGSYLASERRATAHAEVWVGEVLCQHGRGGAVDAVYLVCGEGCDASAPARQTVALEFATTRDGQLRISLPEGAALMTPNPRRAGRSR